MCGHRNRMAVAMISTNRSSPAKSAFPSTLVFRVFQHNPPIAAGYGGKSPGCLCPKYNGSENGFDGLLFIVQKNASGRRDQRVALPPASVCLAWAYRQSSATVRSVGAKSVPSSSVDIT
jgi:hypothetical protein